MAARPRIICIVPDCPDDRQRGTLCHAGQTGLTRSVTNCEHRAIGSNGGFGYKALHDNIEIALLESVVLANWACSTQKKKGPQQVSY